MNRTELGLGIASVAIVVGLGVKTCELLQSSNQRLQGKPIEPVSDIYTQANATRNAVVRTTNEALPMREIQIAVRKPTVTPYEFTK